MAGYTRQATANIQTGKVIYAEDINAEYNALAAAFSGSSGHSHDGSTGNGPKINLVNSVEGVLPLAMGGTGASNASGARTAIGAHNASNLTTGTLPSGRLSGNYSFGSLTLSGTLSVSSRTEVSSAIASRPNDARNISLGERSARGASFNIRDAMWSTWYINREDISSGYEWRTHANGGAFNTVATLSNTGVLSAARFDGLHSGDGSLLTNLNASAISTGTLPANRLPNHSADLLTSGTLPSGRLSGNYSFGSLTLSGNLNLTSGHIAGDAAQILTNPGGWTVRTLNNSSNYILSVQSSGGAERFKVVHGAPLLKGDSTGWSVDGAFTATTISGTLSGNGSGITNINASNISSGTLNDARIPNLNASKVTAGAFHVDRIPALPASKITSGTFSADRIPSLDASILGSGTVPAARLSGNYSFGSLTLSGSLTTSTLNVSTTSSNAVALSRTSQEYNVSIRYQSTAGSVYAGQGAANTFSVGGQSDLRTNTWMTVTSSIASFSGTISGNGSGITNLNASNISSGTLPAARLPNHSAALLTSGTLPAGRLSGNYSFGSLTLSGTLDTSGNITAPRIRLTVTSDASLTSTNHALQIGPDSGSNLIIDNNEIMSRSNGAAATLYLNNDGGLVQIGNGGLDVGGTISGNGSGLTNLNGSNISSGTVEAARIANLPASKITSGTFNIDRIPNIPADKLPSTVATVSTTGSASTTNFPVGHTVICGQTGGVNRNATDTVRLADNSGRYATGGSGSILSGTWRARGWFDYGQMFQRVA